MSACTVTELLALDCERECDRIASAIREQVTRRLKRRGAVIGLSGGIDSSVTAALCVRALGVDRVFGLLMPEKDSAPESLDLALTVAAALGIRTAVENITPILEAAGCYRQRDEAIRSVVPEYGPGYRSKMTVTTTAAPYRVYSIVIESPAGRQTRARLTAQAYLAIGAAMNLKQRVRKMLEYRCADLHRYAVIGTPNRLEYDQGFFVKNGDGAADVKPIAHLYKTQVYQLAEHLGIPEAIRRRSPTTDTYSLTQSQEEFYFGVPYETLDLCLYGRTERLSASDLAAKTGLDADLVDAVYRDIESKRRATDYLRSPALGLFVES